MLKCVKIVPGAVAALFLAAASLWSAGCSDSGEKKQANNNVVPVIRDVPGPLRGTIGAEATLRGIEPVLVSGLGLVVGLDGTGGGPYPASVQGTMEREIGKQGMGKGTLNDGGPLAGMTPQQILADKNVAVVIVEGVIAPGSPKGTRFDLRVSALPGTGTTSLENGRLWTTDLRFGRAAVFGAAATRVLGQAKGAVFINPFAFSSGEMQGEGKENGGAATVAADGVVRTVGRILGGGIVTEPLQLELVLDNSSHARASAMQNAINGRFPPHGGDPTAHGRGAQSIAIKVPDTYRDRGTDFVNTLMAMRIDTQFSTEYAKRYVDELEKYPGLADRLQWCIEAIGEAAVPFLSRLYDFPEFLPRIAALRAGARLGDPRAAAYLIREAKDPRSSIAARAEAAELMGYLGSDPTIDLALRDLVNAEDLEVRAAAYESMAMRHDGAMLRLNVENKFILDLVPSKRPLIYVTQQGEPRVVVFGDALSLQRPMMMTAWDDRLLMVADAPGTLTGSESDRLVGGGPGQVRVQYRDPRAYPGSGPMSATCTPDLVSVIRLFARSSSPDNPEPGLGMSYSQVVGALYQIQKQGGVQADFATERDRLGDRVQEAQAAIVGEDRPESEAKRIAMKERAKLLNPLESKKSVVDPEAGKGWVVPIAPRPKKSN